MAYIVVPRQNPDTHVGTIRKFSSTMIQLDFSCARGHVRWHVEIPRTEPESSIVHDFASLHVQNTLYSYHLEFMYQLIFLDEKL